jgi:hypothetical protein
VKCSAEIEKRWDSLGQIATRPQEAEKLQTPSPGNELGTEAVSKIPSEGVGGMIRKKLRGKKNGKNTFIIWAMSEKEEEIIRAAVAYFSARLATVLKTVDGEDEAGKPLFKQGKELKDELEKL